MYTGYGFSPDKMEGVVIGTVVSTNDTAGQGRILVDLPWLEGRNQSYWAAQATLMTGGGRGSWFMPEKGDEVLLAFDHCDVNHPYIIGFLWNGVDKPPESDAQMRVIVTPGGHSLRFEDKPGSKKVILRTNDQFEICLDDAAKTITVKTPGKKLTMTLDDNASSITLNGGGRIFEMANGMVTIK